MKKSCKIAIVIALLTWLIPFVWWVKLLGKELPVPGISAIESKIRADEVERYGAVVAHFCYLAAVVSASTLIYVVYCEFGNKRKDA